MADSTQPAEQKVSFKDTLNLPTTEFPIRPNAKVDDPAMIERWEKEDLFKKSFECNDGNTKFILHDGPPYANGHLHLGHAYNKILKDIVTKSQRMLGKHVPVTPGWDCHGLPIELKVSQENPGIDAVALKKKCREYANHWIDVQRSEFKRLGVLMDWDNPYITMSYSYEASILRAFGEFVDQGYIERKNKTVPWCASCQTVLASAEIEYQERKDPSIYVLFALEKSAVARIAPEIKDKSINLLIWTTTPWTLPLNRAVLMRPDTTYVITEIQGTYVVVAKELVARVENTVGQSATIVAEFNSSKLVGARALHPFIDQLSVPIILDQSVSLEDGTANVHCAPGCGPEDYEVAVKNGLEIFSPLTPGGKYAKGIQPQELEGMSITDGQIWVLKKLTEHNTLFFKTSIRHSYPHCWRCRNGLMFRATKQWFCDLSKGDLKNRVLEAINDIKTLPEKSSNRLKATVEGRLEWCLSRQRVWGVPIPALLCKDCDHYFVSKVFIDAVALHVEKHGIEYWDEVSLHDLGIDDKACEQCGSKNFVKEKDILDVWFDSGVSHYAVLEQRSELAFPADMYLEGKDQHRGWFQSSLLTSMVLNNKACMRTIVTHGFTVDDKGRKMSKSLGNVVAPREMIDRLGTDGLRLWVSSIDCESDAVVSELLLQNVQEVFRKIRNTCRFLLSNIYDYDHEKDAVPLKELNLLDQYALEQLFKVNHAVLNHYKSYDFTKVFHALADYCAVELSAFYLDIIKDRLYTEKAHGHARRSAQTVCWYILDTLTKLIAPVMSFTAEQLSDHYQKNKEQSIHLQSFNSLHSVWELLGEYYAQAHRIILPQFLAVDIEPMLEIDARLFTTERETQWLLLKEIRSALLKALEVQREKGMIKHSLEARLTICIDTKYDAMNALEDFYAALAQSGQRREDFFKEFLIVSQVRFVSQAQGLEESELQGLWVRVEHAHGQKCPRCWQWQETENQYNLCDRCQEIVK
jgi:isoleucyl-tRNA synthetase